MYGIDNSVASDNGIKSIGVGLQGDITMTKVAYEPASSKEGAMKALVFAFRQSPDNGTFRHLEFAIDDEREKTNASNRYDLLVKQGKTPDAPKPLFIQQYVQRAYKDQAARIKHIMSKFLPEAQTLITGVSTFEQFSNAVVRALGNSYADKKLRLKLVYNSKDYVIFPRWANFIELQTDAPTTLFISKKDRVTKQTPDSASTGVADSEY
jgi:hypothetical protein